MSRARILTRPPRLLGPYARTAMAALPGAGRLPFLPGGGGRVPELELKLTGVRAQPAPLAAYRSLCGFPSGEHLPGTYPHILAFPLHMALMSDQRFPLAPAGLVHIENSIRQHRPISRDQTLELRVSASAVGPHPRGRVFSLLTQAHADGEQVWESTSTMLKRTKAPAGPQRRPDPGRGAAQFGMAGEEPETQIWDLPADLGRRYGALSGDRNPIHMHPLPARAMGFRGTIAHGMWTNARVLAAIQEELPDAYAIEVSFLRPIVLPATVQLSTRSANGESELVVRSAAPGSTHLRGRVRPLESQPETPIKRGEQAT